MKAARVVAIALVVSACASVSPVPIRAGDICFHCRRTITDTALAAEVISEQGHAFKFSSVTCLTDYLRDHPEEQFKATFVADYPRGRLIRAEKAWYVQFPVDPPINRPEFAAFLDKGAADEFAGKHKTAPVAWDAVMAAQSEHAAH